MLDRYLQDKLSLYTQFSDFACPDACPRYGCRSDLVVTVSLLELYVQARFLKRGLLDLFDDACCLSPSVEEGLGKARIRFVMRKPCLFLKDDGMCAIHEVRAAVCALFPEHLALLTLEERLAYIRDNDLGHYPCVCPAFCSVSGARKESLRRLLGIHATEICATEIYLFGQAGFTVDLRSDIADASATIERTLPFAALEASLERVLKKEGGYQAIREKMAALDKGRIQDYTAALSIAEAIV